MKTNLHTVLLRLVNLARYKHNIGLANETSWLTADRLDQEELFEIQGMVLDLLLDVNNSVHPKHRIADLNAIVPGAYVVVPAKG
jgi:hypothetical protein